MAPRVARRKRSGVREGVAPTSGVAPRPGLALHPCHPTPDSIALHPGYKEVAWPCAWPGGYKRKWGGLVRSPEEAKRRTGGVAPTSGVAPRAGDGLRSGAP